MSRIYQTLEHLMGKEEFMFNHLRYCDTLAMLSFVYDSVTTISNEESLQIFLKCIFLRYCMNKYKWLLIQQHVGVLFVNPFATGHTPVCC